MNCSWDRFGVDPIEGRVALLNYEVSGPTVARWAADHGVPVDRFVIVNLRGRRNPLAHPEDRAKLAGILRAMKVQSVIVDPFGRAYTGSSQNDSGEVGAWLVSLDRFVRSEVGARDLGPHARTPAGTGSAPAGHPPSRTGPTSSSP